MAVLRDLESLLQSLFSSEELRRFVSYLPGGDVLLGELPGAGTSPASFVHELVDLLKRRGRLADSDFWGELRAERRYRVSEIDALRSRIADAVAEETAVGEGASKTGSAEVGSAHAGNTNNGIANTEARVKPSTRRVLFVSASPDELPRLRVDQEFRELQSRLQSTGSNDRLELIHMPASRLEDLQRGLLQYEPDVLHISCHGTPEGALCFDSGGSGDYVPSLVKPESMLRLLRAVGESLELVILNACHSAPLAREISAIVGIAISMEGSIADDEAIRFSAAFYEVLAFGRPVAKAFEAALAGLDGGSEPCLFLGSMSREGTADS